MATEPERVIDRQIEAFNAADVEAMLATFAPDAELVTMLGAAAPIIGRDAIRAHYTAMFGAFPGLKVAVVGRLVLGPIVTDHERIEPVSMAGIAVYQVSESLIQRAWMFGPMTAPE
jgi:uncharacterized protein (TIGR02246 family)